MSSLVTRPIAIFLIIFFGMAIAFGQNDKGKMEREWPSEISMEIKEEMFLKFYEGCEVLKNKKQKFSVVTLDGKLIRGVVSKLTKDKLGLLDYQNVIHAVPFDKIKARYIAKGIAFEEQNERILYALGILFYYEKEWGNAESYFQKSLAKGYQESASWIAKSKEKKEIDSKKLEEDERENEEKLKKQREEREEARKELAKKEEAKREEERAKKQPGEKILFLQEGGKEVQVESLLVRGKVTIFQFTADWCGPCRSVSPKVEQLVKSNDLLYLRKIDIVNWKTPVVSQFKIRGIPYFMIYNAQGKLEKQGGYELIQAMMKTTK